MSIKALPLCDEAVNKAARAMGADHPEVLKRRNVRDRLQHKCQAA